MTPADPKNPDSAMPPIPCPNDEDITMAAFDGPQPSSPPADTIDWAAFKLHGGFQRDLAPSVITGGLVAGAILRHAQQEVETLNFNSEPDNVGSDDEADCEESPEDRARDAFENLRGV